MCGRCGNITDECTNHTNETNDCVCFPKLDNEEDHIKQVKDTFYKMLTKKKESRKECENSSLQKLECEKQCTSITTNYTNIERECTTKGWQMDAYACRTFKKASYSCITVKSCYEEALANYNKTKREVQAWEIEQREEYILFTHVKCLYDGLASDPINPFCNISNDTRGKMKDCLNKTMRLYIHPIQITYPPPPPPPNCPAAPDEPCDGPYVSLAWQLPEHAGEKHKCNPCDDKANYSNYSSWENTTKYNYSAEQNNIAAAVAKSILDKRNADEKTLADTEAMIAQTEAATRSRIAAANKVKVDRARAAASTAGVDKSVKDEAAATPK